MTRRASGSPSVLAGAILASAALGACGDGGGNFSQRPGFAAYFAAHPPATSPPSAADRSLLRRYRPRLFLPEGHEGPIHFYDDYIAQGRLTGGKTPGTVTRKILNRVKEDPHVEFVHVPSGAKPRATLFGRIDRETLTDPRTGAKRPLTFLTYHAVFRHSGLPAGLDGWKAAALGLFGSLDDWHQLDHYTAVMIVLDSSGRPVAATFQHHNYMRSFVFGRDLVLPPDGRIAIDVALRSNELYPHHAGRQIRRAAGFLNPESARYLVTGKDKPFRAADDITDPAREADYALVFLPPADAFYTFKGYLGERRMMPGRSGPPGADYNTMPALKPRARQLTAFHWHENDTAYLSAMTDIRTGRTDGLTQRLLVEIDCVRPIVTACAE